MPDQLDIEQVLRDEQKALGLEDQATRSALCVSGGGIRSATFGLGAIQGLAQHGLLGKFDYLSTVSGGGYIGSWLTAWLHRAQGIVNVIPSLRSDAPQPAPGEPDPIQHLRDYNSYLTPKRGAFSADLWTLIATVLRNILLNWMVLIPLLMAFLMLPRFYLSMLAFPALIYNGVDKTGCPVYDAEQFNVISKSPLVAYVLPFLSLLLFATALVNTLRYLPGVGGRDHSRYDYNVKVLAPLVGAVLTFMMFDSLYYLGGNYIPYTKISDVVLWTTLPCAAAWIAFLILARQPFRERLRLLLGPLSLGVAAMAAGTGIATWFLMNYVLWNPDCHQTIAWATYVMAGPPFMLLGYCLGTVLFVGLSSSFLGDEDREWMSRAMAGVLLFAVAWASISGVVLVLPEWVLTWRTWGQGALALGGALSAWLSTADTLAAANANPGAAKPNFRDRMLSAVARSMPAVFIALLIGALSLFTNLLLYGHVFKSGEVIDWREHSTLLDYSNPILIAVVAAGLAALSTIMARFVNINTFSLHGMYRNRLVRAYLGASNPARQASRFTGLASTDDIAMARLDPKLRPFHVINLTLNLVAGSRLAWQQRKAAPFTVTALHCGSSEIGYRPSVDYAGGLSLGTAVAISGAAASPNMGYHTSRVAGFIMTLFNARLGAWLGNPGAPGHRTWKQPGPMSAIRSLVKEGLGQTSEESEYVYLSDGGHFENLGLYEMVRRRCRLIVVLDSGCDPNFTYGDLGNALRKIRIDLRIPIEFDDQSIALLRQKKRRWAVAKIRYAAVNGAGEDGRLVYIKPMLLGNEPPDVLSYAAAHQSFPHQSTNDQWFDESQTESYRQLGLFTLGEMCRGWSDGSLADWSRHIEATKLENSADAP